MGQICSLGSFFPRRPIISEVVKSVEFEGATRLLVHIVPLDALLRRRRTYAQEQIRFTSFETELPEFFYAFGRDRLDFDTPMALARNECSCPLAPPFRSCSRLPSKEIPGPFNRTL